MAPAPASERRTVAVLFSDLSGFTRLSEQMDPEDVRDMVDALFARFRAVVEEAGGVVDKFIGDAVMAVFGAPVAHEDDAARAVRAGLGMQAVLRAFNAERGLELRLRVGINAGEVLWGSLAGERPTAIGDAVNVAQRLEGAARPGTVLVSRSVEREAARAFRFSAGESIAVKGRVEPVQTFVAEEAQAAGVEKVLSLVGRERELTLLLERAARGAFLSIEGEAGIGKSRLLAEFATRFGGATWVGRASDGARVAMEAPAEVLRSVTGVEGAGPAEAARVADGIASAFGEGCPAAERETLAQLVAWSAGFTVPGSRVREIEPARQREESHRAWAEWLLAAAARRPVALCLEDLHWADEATLALLQALPARLAGAPVSIFVTSRPGGGPKTGYERLDLHGLPREGVLEFAAAVLGRPAAPDLAKFLCDTSSGNPYYVEELARFLTDENAIEGDPARLVSQPSRMPDGLLGLLVARLDALGAEEKEAVKGASIVGRETWRGLLTRVLGRDAGEPLERAQAHGLLVAEALSLIPGDAAYSFRQALCRNAAYSLLTKKERTRLHQLAAGALEALGPAAGRPVRALAAAQRESAAQPAEALRLWQEIAEQAMAVEAYEEAARAAREAARLGGGARALMVAGRAALMLGNLAEADGAAAEALRAEAVDGDLRAGAHCLLADIRERRRDWPGVFAAAGEAIALARDPAVLMNAHLNHLRALLQAGRFGEFDRELALCRERLSATPGSPESAAQRHGRSHLHNLEGQALARQSRFPEATSAYRRALECLQSDGRPSTRAALLVNLGDALRIMGKTTEAIACHRESLELRRPVGDRFGVAAALNNLGSVLVERGDMEEAVALLTECLAIRRDLGVPLYICSACSNLAQARSVTGDLDAAVALQSEALELCRRAGDTRGLGLCLQNLAYFAWRMGDFGRATQYVEESFEWIRKDSDAEGLSLSHLIRAMLRSGTGDTAGAEADFHEALEAARGAGLAPSESSALASRSRARLDRGAVAEALADAEDALRVARTTDTPRLEVSARTSLASALAAAGRDAEARIEATAALEGARQYREVPDEAEAGLVLAVLAARAGDSAGAAAHLAGVEALPARLIGPVALRQLAAARVKMPHGEARLGGKP